MNKILSFLCLTLAACRGPQVINDCEVGIVGGGVAGVYLAYKLAPKHKDQICLFEKESELGGRVRDEKRENTDVWVGTGARRVNDTQAFVLNLGKELGIEFQTPKTKKQLIHTRIRKTQNAHELEKDFPGLIGPLDKDPSTTREDEIYTLLLQEKDKASQYPNLKSFIEAIAGKEAIPYLSAMSRFHADFQYDISAPNYFEYLVEEFKLSGTNLYPVGGMSSFIRAMEKKSIEYGVKFYKSEAVQSIEETKNGYRLQTEKRSLNAHSLVLALPPSGLNHIKGSIAESIKNSPQYQSILPIPIVVINQWWDKAWWKNLSVWRAWSNDQCVNHVEIPQEEYAAKGLVTRSVYTDDKYCVEHFQTLMKNEGLPGIEKELKTGLSKLFDVKIPKALRTSYHYWSAGWYYVKAGSKYSNQDIVNWALEPLPGKKNLSLVGESYWLNRPGWSVGAYASVENLLSSHKF